MNAISTNTENSSVNLKTDHGSIRRTTRRARRLPRRRVGRSVRSGATVTRGGRGVGGRGTGPGGGPLDAADDHGGSAVAGRDATSYGDVVSAGRARSVGGAAGVASAGGCALSAGSSATTARSSSTVASAGAAPVAAVPRIASVQDRSDCVTTS